MSRLAEAWVRGSGGGAFAAGGRLFALLGPAVLSGWIAQGGLVRAAVAQGPVPRPPQQLPGLGGAGYAPPPEPTSPPAQHVRDARGRLSFDLPAGWNLSRRDGEISTFDLDARTALPQTQMQAVAGLDFNPFPYSTFAGALFYVSATPRSTPLQCSNQAVAPPSHPVTMPVLDGVTFKHGYAEHGGMCIESRDEVYTALRAGTCVRFDLVINTFCAQASGAREMTAGELSAVRRRLEGVLGSVKFDESPATAAGAGQPASAAPGLERR